MHITTARTAEQEWTVTQMANITVPIQINLPEDWIERIVNRLKNDPEAEWVQIVRCKDCKYNDENWRRVSVRWLPCMDMRFGSNWYCGYGERSEE